jgi:hypothetical protein
MRFRFEGEGGNNFFLDDINLYSGGPSNELVLAAVEQNQFNNLVLYPNPTDGDVHLEFSTQIGGAAQLRITDLSGKVIAHYPLYVQVGQNLVITDTTNLASGSYLLVLELNGVSSTKTFVVE